MFHFLHQIEAFEGELEFNDAWVRNSVLIRDLFNDILCLTIIQ